MNVNEEMLAGYADPDASYSDADPDATQKGHCNDSEVNLCEQSDQIEEKPLSVVVRRMCAKRKLV